MNREQLGEPSAFFSTGFYANYIEKDISFFNFIEKQVVDDPDSPDLLSPPTSPVIPYISSLDHYVTIKPYAAADSWRKLFKYYTGPIKLTIENNIDNQGPPENFEWMSHSVFHPGVKEQKQKKWKTELIGCDHDSSVVCNAQCRCNEACKTFYKNGNLVKMDKHTEIYECNENCPCPPSCPTRRSQHPPKIDFTIYRYPLKGWGVKTDVSIQKGQYVAHYMGEIVELTIANKRNEINQEKSQKYTYALVY